MQVEPLVLAHDCGWQVAHADQVLHELDSFVTRDEQLHESDRFDLHLMHTSVERFLPQDLHTKSTARKYGTIDFRDLSNSDLIPVSSYIDDFARLLLLPLVTGILVSMACLSVAWNP